MKLTKKIIKEAIEEALNEQDGKYIYEVYIYRPDKSGFAKDRTTIGYYESDNIVARAAAEVATYGWDDGEGYSVGYEKILLNNSQDTDLEYDIIRAGKALAKEVGFKLEE